MNTDKTTKTASAQPENVQPGTADIDAALERQAQYNRKWHAWRDNKADRPMDAIGDPAASAPKTRELKRIPFGRLGNQNTNRPIREERTIPAEKPTAQHNWHLDADGVEVAKGQGEGVSEAETEREPSASKADLIAHIDFLTRKRAQESQRYAKLWEERHDLKAHADKLAEALRILNGCAERALDQSATHDGLSNAKAIADARQALAAYESEVQS